MLAQDLTPMLWDPAQIEALDRAAVAAGLTTVPVHLKLDTGMGRLGATARTFRMRQGIGPCFAASTPGEE